MAHMEDAVVEGDHLEVFLHVSPADRYGKTEKCTNNQFHTCPFEE
jgi:hypothetical protein